MVDVVQSVGSSATLLFAASPLKPHLDAPQEPPPSAGMESVRLAFGATGSRHMSLWCRRAEVRSLSLRCLPPSPQAALRRVGCRYHRGILVLEGHWPAAGKVGYVVMGAVVLEGVGAEEGHMVERARPGVGTVALVATAAAGAEAGEKEMAAVGVAVELKEAARAAAVMRAVVAATAVAATAAAAKVAAARAVVMVAAAKVAAATVVAGRVMVARVAAVKAAAARGAAAREAAARAERAVG